MKWSHIDLAVAVSTGRAWWEEIEPFYGENRWEIGPDRRAARPMISPPCSSPGVQGEAPGKCFPIRKTLATLRPHIPSYSAHRRSHKAGKQASEP